MTLRHPCQRSFATAVASAVLATLHLAQAYPGPMDFNCTQPVLSVTFGEPLGKIQCGQKMHKTNPALATAPAVSMKDADDGKGYVLMMIDPDAPSHAAPTYSPIRHWLVVNIPGAALKAGTAVSKGETLSKYHAPGPPAGTGYHRYVYVVAGGWIQLARTRISCCLK
jgi:phosphatidylethanolamine-binding protein (PEBP) family uncharacterized protein